MMASVYGFEVQNLSYSPIICATLPYWQCYKLCNRIMPCCFVTTHAYHTTPYHTMSMTMPMPMYVFVHIHCHCHCMLYCRLVM